MNTAQLKDAREILNHAGPDALRAAVIDDNLEIVPASAVNGHAPASEGNEPWRFQIVSE